MSCDDCTIKGIHVTFEYCTNNNILLDVDLFGFFFITYFFKLRFSPGSTYNKFKLHMANFCCFPLIFVSEEIGWSSTLGMCHMLVINKLNLLIKALKETSFNHVWIKSLGFKNIMVNKLTRDHRWRDKGQQHYIITSTLHSNLLTLRMITIS